MKALVVLCAFLLSVPAVAGELSDLAVAEAELRREKEAEEIYKRARKRAWRAALRSSVGTKERIASKAYKRLGNPYERLKSIINSYDRRFGKGGYITRHLFKSCDDGAQQDEFNHDVRSCEEYLITNTMVVQERKRIRPTIKARSKLHRYIKALKKKKYRLVDKLTRRFLKDEARKLKERKLLELRRILKKLAKKKGMTI